jgi:parallel beta-helix repeat protein
MSRIEVKSARNRGGVTVRSRNGRLRPSLMALEDRALLSTLMVTNARDDGSPGTLRSAIIEANNSSFSDTIAFSSLFDTPQTITLSLGPLTLQGTATTTITGPGATLLTIDADKASRVFEVQDGPAAISGLTVIGGTAEVGGGLYNSAGILDLTDVTVSGNTATAGGGGLATVGGGSTTLTDCVVSGNTAQSNGGGLYNDGGGTTLTNCTVSGNTSQSNGGGLATTAAGGTELTDCTVRGNTASGNGGGIYNVASSTTLGGCTVSGNTAESNGGGMFSTNSATLGNVTIAGNTAIDGGGLFFLNGLVTLTNATVSGNTALSNVGGLYIFPGVVATVTNTIVAGQAAGTDTGVGTFTGSNNVIGVDDPLLGPLGDYGGPTMTMPLLPGSPAIGGGTAAGAPASDQRGQPRAGSVDIGAFQGQPVIVVNTTVAGVGSDLGDVSLRQAVNLANVLTSADTISFDTSVFAAPQVITLTSGPLVLTDSATTTILGPGAKLLTVSSNKTSRVFLVQGGSAAMSGLTITDGVADRGGGLYDNRGILSMTGVTVCGNTARYFGGGVYNRYGTLTLSDTTISGNSAAFGFGSVAGGGLATGQGGSATLTNCTVSGNTSTGFGGGLYNCASTLALINCTVSGNSAAGAPDLYILNDSTTTLKNTIISGSTGGIFTGTNNVIGDDPLLAPLGYYGGQTMTMPLLPGSLAIGAGTTGADVPKTDQRGQDRTGGVDIGAFQSQGFTLTLGTGSAPQNAIVSAGFANPLTVAITSNNPVEPVDGGVIRFGAPRSGASATLSAATAVIAGGRAGVTAKANVTPGSYTVTASAAGVTTTADFALTNTPGPAASVTVVSGSGQSATVATGFASPLVAVVKDAFGNPVPGVSVTFAAPASGASATLTSSPAVTGDDGRASVTAAAGATIGAYTVTASVTGVTTDAAFMLTNTDSPSLVVDTVLDLTDGTDGMTSLREALAFANSRTVPSTVTFSPSVFGETPQTITLTQGQLTLNGGASIFIAGPGANLLTVSGNNASGVFDVEGDSVSLSGLTVTGGRDIDGGGLYNNGGDVSLTNVIVTNNAANQGGGAFNQTGGTISLTDTTFSNNSGDTGGGLFNNSGGTMTLTNCTVNGNTAPDSGGGLYNNASGTMTLTNCTISGNAAGVTGGGLYISPGATATLTNSIVAGGNAAGDIRGALSSASANNLVGSDAGMTGISDGSQGNQIGTVQLPINPLLSLLGAYGGPTSTMALLPGSPALGGGASGPGVPTTDQRGRVRPKTGAVDIGAFQSAGFVLTPANGSTPQSAVATTIFPNPLAVTVTANDPIEPVDGGVVSFAVPTAGASAILSAATAIIENGQASGTPTASVTATANNKPGTYTVTATAAGAETARFDLTNTELKSLKLTTSRDVVDQFDSLTSLREAIAYANSHPGPDTITFDSSAFGTTPQTIVLSGGPLVLTDPATTTIVGPGANLLMFNGTGQGPVFDIQGGSVALSGTTITGGNGKSGGGLLNAGGTVSLNRVVVRGNRALAGGGLYNDGAATLTNVLIPGNRARVGSGLFNTRRAIIHWRRALVDRTRQARISIEPPARTSWTTSK